MIIFPFRKKIAKKDSHFSYKNKYFEKNNLGYQNCMAIGRASLVFILRDVTRFTPLLARLVQ